MDTLSIKGRGHLTRKLGLGHFSSVILSRILLSTVSMAPRTFANMSFSIKKRKRRLCSPAQSLPERIPRRNRRMSNAPTGYSSEYLQINNPSDSNSQMQPRPTTVSFYSTHRRAGVILIGNKTYYIQKLTLRCVK